MPQTTDKFYNLQIDLVKNGQTVSEKAAVSSIVEKAGTSYFNIYIYRLDKSFVFEKHFIRSVRDLSRDKVYDDINLFIKDFNETIQQSNNLEEIPARKESDLLSSIYNDVVILLFFAENDIDDNSLKIQVVNEYIQKKLPHAQNLSPIYIGKYLSSVGTSNNDFYEAIPSLLNKSEKDLAYFLKTLIKICLSDGRLHYTERLYSAEIMQMFRLRNRKLPDDFLRL